MIYAAAIIVQACYIAMKAAQQRQVQACQYWLMPPLSFGMAFCEIFLWANIAKLFVEGNAWRMFFFALAVGTGASIGSITGTYLHKRRHG